MNNLDKNLMKYECNIENKLENNCNDYFAPNIGNHFWYSSRIFPQNDFKYTENCLNINHNNSEQQIHSAIHKLRTDSNQSLMRCDSKEDERYESSHNPKESLKRSHFLSSNNCEDSVRKKRSRNSDSNSSHSSYRKSMKSYSHFFSNSLLECKYCFSVSHSSYDFKNHLKGKRHAMNMKSLKTKGLSKSQRYENPLERDLEETDEPVVGLDFINEIEFDEYRNDSLFDCQLCHCFQMKTSSVLQHILGFRHKLNFIKFLNSRDSKYFEDENRDRHKDSEIIRSLGQKFERLYGRGNCIFISNAHKQRRINRRRSRCQSVDKRNDQQKQIQNESREKSVLKNDSKSYSIDRNIEWEEKVFETLKTIRELCDETLELYSIKSNESLNCLIQNRIIENNANNQLNGRVVQLEHKNGLKMRLDSTSSNSGVISSQLNSYDLSILKTEEPIVCNSYKDNSQLSVQNNEINADQKIKPIVSEMGTNH